jgi:hypothetical protein
MGAAILAGARQIYKNISHRKRSNDIENQRKNS